ncbi:hypothetical protein [Nonomuraea maritima]
MDEVIAAQTRFDEAELRADRVSQTWVRSDGRWRPAGIQFSPLASA